MKRNTRKILSAFLLLALSAAALAGCAAVQKVTGQTGSSGATPGAVTINAGNLSADMRLAVGTLKLEDTDLAVTAEQAQNLLPLWKAVKTLGTSDTAAQEEINGLYAQIRETMSTEQINAIDAMSFEQADLTALMAKLGIDPAAGMVGPGGANLTDDQRATRVAGFQAENPNFVPGETTGRGQGGGAGGPPGGFVISGDGAGGPPAGANGGPFTQGGAAGTPDATRMAGRGASMGMSRLFIDPLITLLEERSTAGA